MDAIKLDNDVNFRISLINALVKEINELSQCTFNIVSPLEVRCFINDIQGDIKSRITSYKNSYGNSQMETVFFFVKEYCIKRFFEEILKYVTYPRKTDIIKTIDKE